MKKSRPEWKRSTDQNWNVVFLQGMEEMTKEESVTITGGESIWYWIGYGLGSISATIKKTIAG